MNTFAGAVRQIPDAVTENGAATFSGSLNACVDLFAKAGAMRTNREGLLTLFLAALKEDAEIALRVLLWLRDVRAGAGERESFRFLVTHMIDSAKNRSLFDSVLDQVLNKIPELGRWDDLVAVVELMFDHDGKTDEVLSRRISYAQAAALILKKGINDGNGLAAKWTPRKGEVAAYLRSIFGLTPKAYRKTIVGLSNTVEQLMCANKWEEIDYSKIPSVAAFRYQSAFEKHSLAKFEKFAEKAAAGEVKVNAGAIFPHTIAKQVLRGGNFNEDFVEGQWNSLPNYVGNAQIIPVVDVSGSMGCEVSPGTSAMDISVGLGAYLATKNRGAYKDIFVCFSGQSEIALLQGQTIVQKLRDLQKARWGMSTNLQAAFDNILSLSVKNNVKPEDMPQMLLVISDMEFNSCGRGQTNFQAAKKKYAAAGYEMPLLTFWNVNARNEKNSPVRFDQAGVALVSGFSTAILEALLAGNLEQFTPQSVMLKKLLIARYDITIGG